jgi:hypothetical protein
MGAAWYTRRMEKDSLPTPTFDASAVPKRHLTPAPPRHVVPLFISLGNTPVGRTRNLSATGIFVETAVRPAIGSEHELSLAWGDSTHSCNVKVVRHADDGIGVSFCTPDAFFSQAIAEILAESPRAPLEQPAL